MSLLLAAVPWWGRILAVGAVLVAAAAFGAAKMHEHDQARYDALEGRFSAFQKAVAEEGKKAESAAKAQAEADRKRKEAADVENSTAMGSLAATILRLRADAGSRPMPAAPACASDPNGAARYRDELQRAYRELAENLRGEAQGRCDPARIGLNTAKAWAQAK